MKQSESSLVTLFFWARHFRYDGTWRRGAQSRSTEIPGDAGILPRHVDDNSGTTVHQSLPVRIIFSVPAVSAHH
jgi:hypothetical protein